jgi:hypothetical protein
MSSESTKGGGTSRREFLIRGATAVAGAAIVAAANMPVREASAAAAKLSQPASKPSRGDSSRFQDSGRLEHGGGSDGHQQADDRVAHSRAPQRERHRPVQDECLGR